jgi:hypothetical protein
MCDVCEEEAPQTPASPLVPGTLSVYGLPLPPSSDHPDIWRMGHRGSV